MIEARYKQMPDGWVGIIYETDTNTVLTCGLEETEEEIHHWLGTAMMIEPWIDGNPSVPDLFDRATRH